MSDKKWSASNYRANKAKRMESLPANWVTNPETGAEFLLRKVGAMAPMIAGMMPSALTAKAVEAWKEAKVEGLDSPAVQPQVEEVQRDLQLMARVVQEACVIPKLVHNPQKEDELDPAELDDKDLMFIFRYATGQIGEVKLKGGKVMDVTDLESFRKRPGVRQRTRSDKQKLSQVS